MVEYVMIGRKSVLTSLKVKPCGQSGCLPIFKIISFEKSVATQQIKINFLKLVPFFLYGIVIIIGVMFADSFQVVSQAEVKTRPRI